MDTLSRIKDSFVQFLSPAAKRRRTVGPGTPSTKDHEYAPISEPRGKKAQAATFDHLVSKYPSTPQPKNPRKRARVEEEDEDTIVVSPGDSISQASSVASESATPGSAESEEVEESFDTTSPADFESDVEDEGVEGDIESDAEDEGEEGGAEDSDEEMVEEEELYSEEEEDDVDVEAREAAASEAKVQEYLARQKEFETIKENIQKAKEDASWHPDALFLYERLALRSFEPLVPIEWQIDFPTLPQVLFTEDDEATFVNHNCLSSYRGIKALQALITLGVRVRDKLSVGGFPEKMVAKEIQNYIRWAERDGGYHKKRFIPVHTVVAARSSQTAGSIGVALASQMNFLSEQHRASLRISDDQSPEGEVFSKPLPLLYGLVVAQTKVILVTHDSAQPDTESKVLSTLDLTNKDMDVWNGFAIAFIVIAARNYIMSMIDELEPDNTMTEDEDA